MPALPPFFSSMVFYVLGPNRKGDIIPLGSGVFVTKLEKIDDWSGDLVNHYAVTARHVLSGATQMQINTRTGARKIPIVLEDWTYREDHEDLAVLDMTDEFDWRNDSYTTVGEQHFADDKFIREHRVRIGDEGFMVGLFSPHPGLGRNFPSARFGCISMLASDKEPIEQPQKDLGTKLKRPAHVFEIHSRPGHSGSPVFIYRTPVTVMSQWGQTDIWQLNTHNNVFLCLLGIHVGQFREPVEAFGTSDYIPSSMTIVVPAKEISELLNMPKLSTRRVARVTRVNDASPSVMAQETVEGEVVSESENSSHKEDF